MGLGSKVRLAEYRRVERTRTKAAGIYEGLEELIVQETELPVCGQGTLAKGFEIVEFEVFQLTAPRHRFDHVKTDLELGWQVGIGYDVRRKDLDLGNQYGSRGHDL
jgi:hypothetical protein